MAEPIAKFTDLKDAELLAKLDETKQELFNLRFGVVTGQIGNSTRLSTLAQRRRPHQHAAA